MMVDKSVLIDEKVTQNIYNIRVLIKLLISYSLCERVKDAYHMIC